jgi:Tol biopolymer transport system component
MTRWHSLRTRASLVPLVLTAIAGCRHEAPSRTRVVAEDFEHPRPRPTGRGMALVKVPGIHPAEVWLADIDGRAPWKILECSPAEVTAQPGRDWGPAWFPFPTWDAEGTAVLFAQIVRWAPPGRITSRVAVASVKDARVVSVRKWDALDGIIWHLSRSPEGGLASFILQPALRASEDSCSLLVMDLDDGRIVRRVAGCSVARTAWSPDGEKLAFCRPDKDVPASQWWRFWRPPVRLLTLDVGTGELTAAPGLGGQPLTWLDSDVLYSIAEGKVTEKGGAWGQAQELDGYNLRRQTMRDLPKAVCFLPTRAATSSPEAISSIGLVSLISGEQKYIFSTADEIDELVWSNDGRSIYFVANRRPAAEGAFVEWTPTVYRLDAAPDLEEPEPGADG